MAHGSTACCGPFLSPCRGQGQMLGNQQQGQSPSSVSWHRAGRSPEKDNTGPQAFRACSMWSPRGVLAWSPSGSEHSTGEGCKAEGGGAGRETKAGVGPLVALAHRGLCVSVKRGRGWPHSLPHGGAGCSTDDAALLLSPAPRNPPPSLRLGGNVLPTTPPPDGPLLRGWGIRRTGLGGPSTTGPEKATSQL